jgi:glycosyltransferase involved in cell wall biosynthesis
MSNRSSYPRPQIGIVCVGQVPPPYHGQAVMIEQMLAGTYRHIRFHHVPLTFSRELADVGRFQLAKLGHLPVVIGRIWWARFRYGARILYHPPAGPRLIPVLRDLVILLLTRPLFPATVFHFHAGGLSELLPRLPRPLRWLAWLAYRQPELAIRIAAATPPDAAAISAHREVLIPNGIADACPNGPPPRPPLIGRAVRLLFVGNLLETKGVLVLIEALRLLATRGVAFEATLVGAPVSSAFETRLHAAISAAGLTDHVHLTGLLTGAAKAAASASADIFCFPTFYEAEAFSVVVIEAMLYSLPVVTTNWRGLPDLVLDGVSGRLVPPRDPEALAQAIAQLLADPDQLQRMGAAGRAAYQRDYQSSVFCERIEAALASLDHHDAS